MHDNLDGDVTKSYRMNTQCMVESLVNGYGNFAILIQSEIFSSNPYPIHIRKHKIMDSDIQSKSETAQSIAH